MKCRKCVLHKYRRNIVNGEGDKPADVLFIGEAPGKTEDLMGRPFVGPSGRVLRSGIIDAMNLIKKKKLSYYISNVVACRPTDKKHGHNREPEDKEVEACRPRLKRIVSSVKPKAIIFLGKVAERHCKKTWPGISIRHPAYVLRKGGIGSPEYRTFIRHLAEVFGGIKKRRRKK